MTLGLRVVSTFDAGMDNGTQHLLVCFNCGYNWHGTYNHNYEFMGNTVYIFLYFDGKHSMYCMKLVWMERKLKFEEKNLRKENNHFFPIISAFKVHCWA